jgi:predicted amidophosphoribosyltransferase
MNFLCVDCLSKTISHWLFSENKELLPEYQVFHSFLLNFFSSEEQEFCLKCRRKSTTILCPYCYTNEVFWWLFTKDIQLAKKFVHLFNFDFLGTGFYPHTKTRNLNSVIINEDQDNFVEIGICENCGQFSENLKKENGSWLCESCREE